MTTISLTDPINGTTADANVIAANNALIENVLNGNVDSSNIAAGSVTASDVATGTFLELKVGGTSRKLAFGLAVLTFSSAILSDNLTVAHGLGVSPAGIFTGVEAGIAYCLVQVQSADATNIVFSGRDTSDTSRAGTNTFWWAAIA